MPKWIYSPLSAIILTLIGISILVSLQKTDEQLAQSAVILEQMRTEVTLLENQVLESTRNSEIATSAANKERIIRDELLQKRPGEYVVQLPNLEELYPEMDVHDADSTQDGVNNLGSRETTQENSRNEQSKTTSYLKKNQTAWNAWKEIVL